MRPAFLWLNGHCYMTLLRGGDGSEETILCTVGAYSWPGDDWSTILCGGKGVYAQPPHSAHKWAPFVFVLIFSSEFEPRILPLQKECIKKTGLPRTYHLLIFELVGQRLLVLRPGFYKLSYEKGV